MFTFRQLCADIYLLALTAYIVSAASADEWRSRTIYQVVTDRFARSDNEPTSCDASQRKYCGGSWKGITTHLDYIQGLGFDAVWISPVVKNIERTTPYGEAYHGYWAQDLYSLNSRFGTSQDLRELSDALHSRGMFLMIDVVTNHFAGTNTTEQGNIDFSEIRPFNLASHYHPRCLITDYNNQTNVEQCWLGDDKFPLPDLNTEDPATVQIMNDWIKELVQTYGIDGLRIDTAKHVRKDFWPDFVKSAGVYTIGEVITEQVSYASEYAHVLDSVLDYPAWFALTKALASPSGNLSALEDVLTAAQQSYRNAAFTTGSFLENHDQPRFQAITQDQALVRNAIAWTFTQDGIPIVYYGQEQGLQGDQDPLNREALWPTGYITSGKPLVNHIRSLNAARRAASSRNNQFLSTRARFIPQPSQAVLAISKPPLLTLLTNVGSNGTGFSSSTSWNIPSSSDLFQRNQVLVDVLTCDTISVNNDGELIVQADGGLPKVLIPASDLTRGGALCPNAGMGDSNGSTDRGCKAANWMTLMSSTVLVAAIRHLVGPL